MPGLAASCKGAALFCAVLLLAGCDLLFPPEPVLKPQARPAGLGRKPPPVAPATSEASARLRARLAQIQSAQLTQGLLRQDGGGPDTPFTAAMLARNFGQLAFFNEYGSANLPAGSADQLRRWESPVRIGVEFGASVPPSRRESDLRDVARYANRLARITGHPISLGKPANFLVLFVSEDDRVETLNATAARLPGLTEASLAPLLNLPADAYCAVAAYGSAENRATYAAAVAVIRAENPDLLRLSCIHEEVAQGLGLANDSPSARPSIFNDDDEFALLTDHDAQLLAMLYDPRLMPGQTLTEAQGLIRQMARERTGEADPAQTPGPT